MNHDPIDESRAARLERDLATMADITARLTDAICAAVPAWVETAIASRASGLDDPSASEAALRRAPEAGSAAAAAAREQLAALAATGLDDQHTTPLGIVRGLVRFVNEVLAEAGVPRPPRDPFEQRANPDDVYAVAVATWADLGEDVHELGMAWGAAKAYLHRAMHEGGTGSS